jgi:hypothetical protein
MNFIHLGKRVRPTRATYYGDANRHRAGLPSLSYQTKKRPQRGAHIGICPGPDRHLRAEIVESVHCSITLFPLEACFLCMREF